MKKNVLTLITLLTLVLSGCVAQPSGLPETPAMSIPESWEPFYSQEVQWEACGDNFECTRVRAPLDWENPQSAEISLAMIRHSASSQNPLGSLFVNPGGPGAPGINFVRDSLDFAVTKNISDSYDVIGFDPRGVGQSTAVTCFQDDAQLDDFLFAPAGGVRGSQEWFEDRQHSIDQYSAACVENSGDLLNFVDTQSAAHDLDMLRAIVGDRYFNFVGYSYGSLLGATYAEMFPANVGRMVLDGALNPASSNFDVSLNQAIGFENALKAYLEDCLESSECPFSGSVESSMNEIQKLLSGLDQEPLTSVDPRTLGADSMVTAIASQLYSQLGWPELSHIFESVFAADAKPAWAAVDWYYNRVNGVYQDNSTEAFNAINCVDYPANANQDQWRKDAEHLAAKAPVIGPYLAWGDQFCLSWPAQPTSQPHEISASGSAPILVIGTTGDPATPYVWAQELAAQLENGYLLTFVGEGHTAYTQSHSCVDSVVDRYLLNGVVPEPNKKC